MNICIVVPVKDFRAAKQRLSGALSSGCREQLARWLCRRTLQFFTRHFPACELLVVTASEDVARLASQQGAKVLLESQPAGVSAAAATAAKWVRRYGFDSMLLVPADIAELDPAEFRTLLRQRRAVRSVILCPAKDQGTNALLCTPPEVISFHFGDCSSHAHRQAAAHAGAAFQLLHLPKLSLDLDTCADLLAMPAVTRAPLRVTMQ